MKKLGELFMPWQYTEPGEECVISDSTVAYDFFKDVFGDDGVVILANWKLSSFVLPFLPVWLYFRPKTKEIVAYQSVFRIDNVEQLDASTVLEMDVVQHDIFFCWKDALYCSVTTSTGEIVIKRIRAILSENDMLSIQRLAPEAECEDIYPVKLYALDDGRFLATCWAMELSNETILFEPVICDDEAIVDLVDPNDTTFYPITIGEKAIIGDAWYEFKCDEHFGNYFNRLPILASKAMRKLENIDLGFKPKKSYRPVMKVSKRDDNNAQKPPQKTHIINLDLSSLPTS